MEMTIVVDCKITLISLHASNQNEDETNNNKKHTQKIGRAKMTNSHSYKYT